MKLSKRVLSILLAALLLFGTGAVAMASANEAGLEEPDWLSDEMTVFFDTASDAEINAYIAKAFTPAPGENNLIYPQIYMAGAWHTLYEYENDPEKKRVVFDEKNSVNSDPEGMANVWSAAMSLDMDALGDALIQMWKNGFEEVAMDRNGVSINPNISSYEAAEANVVATTPQGLPFGMAKFSFDWRLDPWDNAERLHDYLEAMVIGYGPYSTPEFSFMKYNVVGVCGSGPILLCYLKRFGTEYLASAVFNMSMHNGSSLFGGVAAGQFGIDAASLSNGGMVLWGLYQTLAPYSPILRGAYEAGLMDIVTKFFNFASAKAIDKFYEEALIPLWFQMPFYWCLVPMELYEQAKAVLFKGNSKYSELLKITDRYHYDVMAIQDQLILKAASEIKMGIRAGYNSPLSPYVKGANVQSDELVDTRFASLGAICVPPGRPFAPSYTQAIPGEKNYISPDRYVDASTCLLPDQTWFARDMFHYPESFYANDTANTPETWWYFWFLGATDYTVWANPDFPQYSQFARKTVDGKVVNIFTPLAQPDPPTVLETILATVKDIFLQLLAAWRWLFLLPLFWM